MRMRQHNRRSLWDLTNESGADPGRFISDASLRLQLETLVRNTDQGDLATSLRNQSVLVSTTEQMTAVVALLALDGLARRILLCPPDLAATHLPHVIATGEVQAVLSDQPPGPDDPRATVRFINCQPNDLAPSPSDADRVATEWILFTSGTTGAPKMVVHTCATLVGSVERARAIGRGAVWSTFYDIRRYGGLQMLLRALVGGGSMVLSNLREPPGEYLRRVAANRVTHISGTPSHWRRALMSPWQGTFGRAMFACPVKSRIRRSSIDCGHSTLTRLLPTRLPRPKLAWPSMSMTDRPAFRPI